MGYLCPVCEEPFGDDTQCADHLAVTAILHGGSHEAWLAEAVDDWESVPRADIATVIAERADETTDHDHPGDHGHTHPVSGEATQVDHAGQTPSTDHLPGEDGQPAITESNSEQLDSEAQAVLSEARELTRKMQQRGPDEDERKES